MPLNDTRQLWSINGQFHAMQQTLLKENRPSFGLVERFFDKDAGYLTVNPKSIKYHFTPSPGQNLCRCRHACFLGGEIGLLGGFLGSFLGGRMAFLGGFRCFLGSRCDFLCSTPWPQKQDGYRAAAHGNPRRGNTGLCARCKNAG